MNERYWNGAEGALTGLLLLLAAVAFAAGLFFRFWQLGDAPLAVDEYYFGMSVLNIVERGLPEFACGGFYTRGILVQYLVLPVLQLGAGLEFAVRFWPAIASVLTIAGVWKIGRLAGGTALAALAVILASLSVWEIEFGRFGRMYAPFQAAFVWYLYFQVRHLVQGRDAAKWWALIVSAVSILIYAGASFLLILNFLPLVWRGRKASVAYLVSSFALLLAGVRFYSFDPRYLGIPETELPPVSDNLSGPSLPINLPAVPDAWLPVIACGIALAVFVLWRLRKRLFFGHAATIYWTLTALSAVFGLFGLAVGLLVAGLLLDLPRPPAGFAIAPRRAAAIAALGLVGWTILLLGLYLAGGKGPGVALRQTFEYVFDFPDVYYHVLRPWLVTIPGTTVAMIVLVAPVLLFSLRNLSRNDSEASRTLRYLLGTLLLLGMLAPFFRQPYMITRYTYFLYPVVLILASAGILVLTRMLPAPRARALAPVAAIAALFLATEDYSVGHLAGINDVQYRYRIAYNDRLAAHYYPRWDFRSPAEYVNERLRPGDRVIVFDQPLPHYLDRTDGIFVRAGTDIHQLTWSCAGQRHLWSNAPLLDEDAEVRRLIGETDGRVWLITRTEAVDWRDPLEKSLVRDNSLQPEYRSLDGHLAVYRLHRSN